MHLPALYYSAYPPPYTHLEPGVRHCPSTPHTPTTISIAMEYEPELEYTLRIYGRDGTTVLISVLPCSRPLIRLRFPFRFSPPHPNCLYPLLIYHLIHPEAAHGVL